MEANSYGTVEKLSNALNLIWPIVKEHLQKISKVSRVQPAVKIIRALEIIRVKKFIPNAVL